MTSTRVEGAGTRIGKQCVAGKKWKRESSLLLVAAILSLALLNGCAGVVSASKTQPVSQGSFQVTPASISFGKVPVGKATSQSLSVSVNPTSAGATTGTLTMQGDGGSSPVVVNLSATGVTPEPQLSLSTTAV